MTKKMMNSHLTTTIHKRCFDIRAKLQSKGMLH